MPLTSVAELIELIRKYQLLEPEQFAQLTQELVVKYPEPRDLGRELLHRGWLTPYQVNHLLIGQSDKLVLGSYLLLDRLGEGGMGQVFKARHQKLGRTVALKLMRKERLIKPQAIRRFKREVRAAATLSHPNVVLAFDADEVGNMHFLVMEYVDGIDLARQLKQAGPLPIEQACEYMRQTAVGLQHAYERGLVHRDIKPANLMVTFLASTSVAEGTRVGESSSQKGAVAVVKILDMGLARLARGSEADESLDTLTPHGAPMGTLDYLAPEQALDSHRVDIRADLYSLGCTFYHLLTGRPPFPGGQATEKLLKHRMDEPVPVEELRPEVPAQVAAIVRKLMAKQPEARYQVPAELAEALACVLGTGSALSAVGRDHFGADDATAIPAAIPIAAPTEMDTRPAFAAGGDPAPAANAASGSLDVVQSRRAFRALEAKRYRIMIAVGSGILLVGLAVFGYLLFRSEPPASEQGSEPVQELAVPIAATRTWQDTGIDVPSGQAVVIRGQGRWQKKGQPACSAQGLESAGRDRVLLLDAPAMCLLARVGEAEVPLVVGSYQIIQVKPGGRLFLQANDLDLEENTGSLQVTIRGGIRSGPTGQSPGPLRVQAAEAALRPLLARSADPKANLDQLRSALVDVVRQYGETHQAIQARTLLLRLPSPLDRIDPRTISPYERRAAGNGDPDKAPSGLVAILGDSRLKHWGRVWAVAFSPDGKVLASAGVDRVVRLWDVATGNELHTLRGHTSEVRAVAFHPDGRLLASGSHDHTIKLWDQSTGELLHTLTGHGGNIASIAFAPNGSLLASGSDDTTVKLWDPVAGKQLQTLAGHTSYAHSVAFRPDGTVLASGGYDATVRLWDVASGKELTRWTVPSNVNCVRYSPDAAVLAGACVDGAVRLWDPATGKELRVLQGHKEKAEALAFRPDGQMLASRSEDGTLVLWDPNGGKDLRVLREHHGRLGTIAFSRDGELLASAGGQGWVHLRKVAAQFDGLAGKWYYIGPFDNTDKKGFATAYAPEKEIDLTKTYTGKNGAPAAWKEFPDFQPGRILDLARFPTNDSSCVYLYHEIESAQARDIPISFGSDDTLTVWLNGELLLNREIYRQAAPDQEQTTFKLKVGTNRLLIKVCNGTGHWQLFVAPAFPALHPQGGHDHGATCVTFADDGSTLAAGGYEHIVRLWDLNGTQPKERLAFRGHSVRVPSVIFTPDGQTVVSGGWEGDRSVKFWSAQTGLTVHTVEPAQNVQSLAISADGKTLAAGCNNVFLWTLGTGAPQQRAVLQGHSSWLNSIALSRDGRTLVSGSNDGTVRVWNLGAAAPKLRAVLTAHTEPVHAVAISPDGRLLVTGAGDKTIHLWSLTTSVPRSLGALEKQASSVSNRCLLFTTTGQELISADHIGRIIWWDPATRQQLRERVLPGAIRGIALAPDGRHLATANGNGTVYLLRLP